MTLLVSFVGAMALLAQQPGQGKERVPTARWLTAHAYGVQLRLDPLAHGREGYRLYVRDLGPELDYLIQDLAPTKARIDVAGHAPRWLAPNPDGDLVVDLPASWGRTQSIDAVVRVFHGSTCFFTYNVKDLLR